MALETSEMDRYGLHLSYKKSGWIPMLLRRFMIANVHFVVRALDFPGLSFEYKDNTMEIQRKSNGNTMEIQATRDKCTIAILKCRRSIGIHPDVFYRTGEVNIYPFQTFLAPSERFEAGESAGIFFCSVSRERSHGSQVWTGTHV